MDEWESAVDPASGQTYYYNIHTDETTWTKPEPPQPRKKTARELSKKAKDLFNTAVGSSTASLTGKSARNLYQQATMASLTYTSTLDGVYPRSLRVAHNAFVATHGVCLTVWRGGLDDVCERVVSHESSTTPGGSSSRRRLRRSSTTGSTSAATTNETGADYVVFNKRLDVVCRFQRSKKSYTMYTGFDGSEVICHLVSTKKTLQRANSYAVYVPSAPDDPLYSIKQLRHGSSKFAVCEERSDAKRSYTLVAGSDRFFLRLENDHVVVEFVECELPLQMGDNVDVALALCCMIVADVNFGPYAIFDPSEETRKSLLKEKKLVSRSADELMARTR